MVDILFGFPMVLDKMAAILFGFPMVLDMMAAILFKTELYWKSEHHWKTQQRATIWIPIMFGMPAPNLHYKLVQKASLFHSKYSNALLIQMYILKLVQKSSML